MGSSERSKRKVQLWKKAIFHFSLCFIMGFFSGFAPTGMSSIFSSHVVASNRSEFAPQPAEVLHQEKTGSGNFNRSLFNQSPVEIPARSDEAKNPRIPEDVEQENFELIPRRLIIIVTPTSSKDHFEEVLVRRLANTLRLVPPPLLWIVTEHHSNSFRLSEILRKTGIMYRHLVYKENYTDPQAEMDHQRNVALVHIEHHRLSGIVHFAGLTNIYDLNFFDEIREIEAFGTWPMAMLAANRKKVIIEGPVCDSSEVIGWHLKKNSNQTDSKTPPIHISSFAFNSSILWDPERWGRPSSVQDTSQNSLKFVKEEVLQAETKLKGIPSEGCSKVMVWNLHNQMARIRTAYNHILVSGTHKSR